ncbi:hypothetical protein IE53DRAFT_368546 [Violaceomyces palustris]|uniref:Uncharacterized protein n=1 Tax=Violaceomyces palustris TaxID=1673888 RepID=A0ACD0NYD5_9BASI|nr:hypothetical protein IE53DRAFT_368546 [Violaceomyces palustris]
MGDFQERNFNTGFQGLVTTTAIFCAVGGTCLVGYETLRQLRRLPTVRFTKFWRGKRSERDGQGGVDADDAERDRIAGGIIGTRKKLTCEDWEMGHLYQARMFHAKTPSPPLSRWPLGWVWQAINFTDMFYAEHTGMDTVVYVRFLRACLYWTLLHTLTTAPILLTIHIKFSRGVDPTDISRASLSYLVTIPQAGCPITEENCPREPNEQGRKLLWIHLTLLWYVSITWVLALWWIGSGSLRIRRFMIDKTREKLEEAKRKASELGLDDSVLGGPTDGALRATQGLPADNSDGWRQRTLMVMNLPSTMRDEASIRRYFEEFLRPDDASILTDSQPPSRIHSRDTSGANNDPQSSTDDSRWNETTQGEDAGEDDAERGTGGFSRPIHHHNQARPLGPEPDINPDRHLKSPVQTVVLVRKMNELSSMLGRRQEVLNLLEAAHVKLAQNVMHSVGRRTQKLRRAEKKENESRTEGRGRKRARRWMTTMWPLSLWGRRRRPHKNGGKASSSYPAAAAGEEDESESDRDVEKNAPKLTSEAKARLDELAKRLARFAPGNHGLHSRDVKIAAEGEDDKNVMHETVWEALATVPRELLDPFQPATRLSALFRGQTVPTIDYLLTKLNLLTALVTEMRSRPPTSYEPTSTAFVTFRDPRQARMVWRELKSQIVVKVRLAPEVKDLDWERLMRTSFTGDLVRGFGVNVAFWGFTIFWVLIIQLITNTLFSIQALQLLPGVAAFFKNNPHFEGFVSVTLPTVIVSLITMSIPELIFQISKRAQGFVTFSALYDQCLCRYWKFVICNVVIFFCVGVTTIKTILQQVDQSGKILDSVAFSFPTAAPFFVSYLILQLGLQSGFEHFGFMIALLQHLGARKAFTPRSRALKTLPRNFNRYYWLPLHILIMAIVMIFALLNPLVIPFALVYTSVALVVFKKNFAYHYYRRFNEKEGVIYFTRILRFSLDSLLTMQIVLLIFFSVTDQGSVYIGMTAVLIPLTVLLKILATRLWKSQCRAVEDEEAEAVCGIDTRPSSSHRAQDRGDYGQEAHDEALDSRAPLDARASGRYPAVVPPPSTGSRFYRAWQMVHDSFNANGKDKPSYLAATQAKGQRVANPVELGAKTLAKTPEMIVKKTTGAGRHRLSAAKAHLGISHFMGGGGGGGKDKTSSSEARSQGNKAEHTPREREEQEQRERGERERAENESLSRALDMGEHAKVGRAVSRRRKGDYGRSRTGLSRALSTRSEEAPFLSGYDAISNHAPVPSEGGDLSFADGDETLYNESVMTVKRRSLKSTPRKKRSQRSGGGYSDAIVRRKKNQEVIETDSHPRLNVGEATEFGDLQSSEDDGGGKGSSHQRLTIDTITSQTTSSTLTVNANGRTEVVGGPLESVLYQTPAKGANHRDPGIGEQGWKEGRADDEGEDDDGDDDDEDDDGDDDDDDDEEDEGSTVGPLVRPHAPVRWDDTPNNSARYNNPFYNRELDPFLWLPRDPLAPLDLCDTIEWHGPALVSSQGGPGRVGEWEEEDDDGDDDDDYENDEDEEGYSKAYHGDYGIRFGEEAGDELMRHQVLEGDEEIIISDSLARHLEEVEDVQDAPDPAASLPRGLMEDYKKAIRRSSRSENDGEGSSTIGSRRGGPRPGMIRRDSSMRSAVSSFVSVKSPTLSARMAADERFINDASGPVAFQYSSSPETIRTISLGGRRRPTTADSDLPPSSPLEDLPLGGSMTTSTAARTKPSERSPAPPVRRSSVAPSTASTKLKEQGQGGGGGGGVSEQGQLLHAPKERSSSMVPTQSSSAGVSFAPIERRPTQHEDRVSSGGGGGGAGGSGSGGKRMMASGSLGFQSSPATHSRRQTNLSSGASVASTNAANRAVTLREALKAEALEEERRITLREKFLERKNDPKKKVMTKTTKKKRGGSEQGRTEEEEQEEQVDDVGGSTEVGHGRLASLGMGFRTRKNRNVSSSGTIVDRGEQGGMTRSNTVHQHPIGRNDSIMARYEARQRRRTGRSETREASRNRKSLSLLQNLIPSRSGGDPNAPPPPTDQGGAAPSGDSQEMQMNPLGRGRSSSSSSSTSSPSPNPARG